MQKSNLYSQSAYENADYLSEEERVPVPTKKVSVKPGMGLELKYKTQRSRAPTKHIYVAKSRLRESAEILVKLVPIRLEIELEHIKVKDVFTWNLNGFFFVDYGYSMIL